MPPKSAKNTKPPRPGLNASEEIDDGHGTGIEAKLSRPTPPVVLVLVGAPGSGKSTFAHCLGPPVPAGPRAKPRASGGGLGGREAVPWRRVCQDLLGNKDACLRAAKASLTQGLSVIVDRTNTSIEQRSTWINLASEHAAIAHCLAFDVPAEECCRRVAQRPAHEGGLNGPGARIVINKLASDLEPITRAEGFKRVRVLQTLGDVDRELRWYGAQTLPGEDGVRSSTPAASTTKDAEMPRKKDEASAGFVPEFATKDRPGAVAAGSTTAANLSGHMDETTAQTTLPEQLEKRQRLADEATEESRRKVAALEAMGFPTDKAQKALTAAGGDTNRAANNLLCDRLVVD